MPFIVKTSKGYIKRTSNFGAFHGNVVLTDDVQEAFRFTRQSDAENRAGVLRWRTRPAVPKEDGRWDFNEGYEHKKFGQLEPVVEEV